MFLKSVYPYVSNYLFFVSFDDSKIGAVSYPLPTKPFQLIKLKVKGVFFKVKD